MIFSKFISIFSKFLVITIKFAIESGLILPLFARPWSLHFLPHRLRSRSPFVLRDHLEELDTRLGLEGEHGLLLRPGLDLDFSKFLAICSKFLVMFNTCLYSDF